LFHESLCGSFLSYAAQQRLKWRSEAFAAERRQACLSRSSPPCIYQKEGVWQVRQSHAAPGVCVRSEFAASSAIAGEARSELDEALFLCPFYLRVRRGLFGGLCREVVRVRAEPRTTAGEISSPGPSFPHPSPPFLPDVQCSRGLRGLQRGGINL